MSMDNSEIEAVLYSYLIDVDHQSLMNGQSLDQIGSLYSI